MKTSPHSKAIEAAARQVLGMLGLKQRGRSRFWYDDHGWYLIGVEFQPSSFAKGSYLNVGCCWLWHAKPHFSFDLGYREESLHAWKPDLDYQPTAEFLSKRASGLVEQYRSQFRTVADLVRYYDRSPPTSFWDCYHAAIAAGLTHQVERAQAWFRAAAPEQTADSPEWLREAADRCMTFAGKVREVSSFRMEVEAEIDRARKMQKLPAVAEPLVGAA